MAGTTQATKSEDMQGESVGPKSKRQKIIHIITRVLTWVIGIFAVGMMIFSIVSVNTFNRIDRNIFGYKAFVVLSDSMKATDFSAGDLIFVRAVDPETLKAGDIITFQSINKESYGEVITHKIREVTTDDKGNPGFRTYGTTTDTNDEAIVTYSFVIGKYTGKIAGLGYFFKFMKTIPGYFVCIFLPCALLIVWQGASAVRMFKRYKKGQREQIQAEKDELAAERAETQRMMAELLALKAQLAENGSVDAGTENGEPAEEKRASDAESES